MTNDILKDRQTTHGTYSDNANLHEFLMAVLTRTEKWHTLPNTVKYGLTCIMMKICRIVNGDSRFADHYDDIAGYAIKTKESVDGIN